MEVAVYTDCKITALNRGNMISLLCQFYHSVVGVLPKNITVLALNLLLIWFAYPRKSDIS